MLRHLTWHIPESPYGEGSQGPAYFIEQEYDLLGIQIHAENAPDGDNLQIDVLEDGMSILRSYATLTEGSHNEEAADRFVSDVLSKGSWVTMEVKKMANAKNVTINMLIEALGGFKI